MKGAKLSRTSKIIGVSVYVLLFLFSAYYVFVADDESQPLIEIFKWNFLVPVMIYAAGTTSVSFILFLILRKILPNIVALLLSIFGLPVGIFLVSRLFILLTQI